MGACAVALWCAVLVAARAAAYTVDCNHEYTDCDTELSKLASDDEEIAALPGNQPMEQTTASRIVPTTRTTSTPEPTTEKKIVTTTTTTSPMLEVVEPSEPIKPKPRLLNLNVDDLQSFANALHNQTEDKGQKKMSDLSDVNLDDDDEEPPRMAMDQVHKHNKDIADKFYSNLQAPFHPMINMDRGSEEYETCKENDVSYKIGDRLDRGCEETCECTPGGTFDCTPRCKHPYIRRGRRLNDPLCFESPVDECCSIIACATGNGETKPTKVEVCRYGNDTYPVGSKWNIGCEQKCSCEPNSVVTCQPRCSRLPQSEKCINVQDPHDECCEVQICDVSQDVHEETVDNVTTSTTTTTTTESIKGFEDYSDIIKSTMSPTVLTEPIVPLVLTEAMRPPMLTEPMRPLVLTEPIGSVKVLQNNSVQVNLMQVNKSEDPIHLLLSSDGGKSFNDVELKYSNLILNLEGGRDYILKTKETGTKFNFTMTSFEGMPPGDLMNATSNDGCYQDGHYYAVGEEFHIGCTELCECTGADTRDCVDLVCPSHVGLEIVSKGCVRWAPSPPPQPPNCCPRSARCLSDGTCHYKGIAIPNWTEVPIALTGCEQRCFCENGELDCQEVCTPLPPVPPQTFRCPPMHRPAAVNISDEDCCKQWSCLPNAEDTNGTTLQTYNIPVLEETFKFVTPVAPILPTIASPVLPTPSMTTDSTDFYRHLHPVKSYPKILKGYNDVPKYSVESIKTQSQGDNITVFTLDDIDSPFKTIQPEHSLTIQNFNWPPRQKISHPVIPNYYLKEKDFHPSKHNTFVLSDDRMHGLIVNQRPNYNGKQQNNAKQENTLNSYDDYTKPIAKQYQESRKKLTMSDLENFNYFLPAHNAMPIAPSHKNEIQTEPPSHSFFQPAIENLITHKNRSSIQTPNESQKSHSYNNRQQEELVARSSHGKQMTTLKNKNLNSIRPADGDEGIWAHDTNTHVLIKAPNPYETVLLRPVSRTDPNHQQNNKLPRVNLSPLDIEHLVSQMELESEVNRNLGRSADKMRDTVPAGQTPLPDLTPNPPQQPSFLPTIPPEIHFPDEDYDQNNLHRPVNSFEPNLPPPPPNYGEINKKLTVISIQADSPTSVKMLFGLPPVLVGLRGSVDLRYTDKADEDISKWYSQVFAPADEILTTPRLEFRLSGLKPSTIYKIRGKLFLHNLPVEPESDIFTIRTLDLPAVVPVEEKRREIDCRLTVVDVNDTAAHVSWRHFTEDELQFIDGIQVRYRPMGTPIYSMTELLHHSRSVAELHELRPGTRYEASMILVPPPRATTELHDPGRVEFTTSPYVDPYNWTVTVEAKVVGSEAAELTWKGVPSPAERWVRVYRAAHACGAIRKEHDAFRLAARDLPPTILLNGLESDSRCRVWLELFLTNGKVKTSNVLEINTKSQDTHSDIDNEIEASSIAGSRGSPRGDYYGALVVVGVVAALGALTSLLLLLVLVRRHRPHSVAITPVPTAPRESSLPPYDNPAYKLELQQETMDL